MHELAIAQSLLNIVLEEAVIHCADKVVKITVKVGAFTNVISSSLAFCFDLIKEGTLAAEAVLEIILVPMIGECQNCGIKIDFSVPIFNCPSCESNAITLTHGRDLYIEHIEIAE